MKNGEDEAFESDVVFSPVAPLREHILDRLADVLVASDEVLSMLDRDGGDLSPHSHHRFAPFTNMRTRSCSESRIEMEQTCDAS